MNIVLDRKIPIKISLVFATLDIESHSAFIDLPDEIKAQFRHELIKILQAVETNMFERRVELGKDRG